MGPPAHLKIFNLELFLSKENAGAKKKKKKKKKEQRLKGRPYKSIPGIDQPPTLLLMPRCVCRQESGMAVL
jgi:hypothetical protein